MNIGFKQLLSELIDISICLLPSIGIFYFSELRNEIDLLNITYILSFVYLVYGIIMTLGGNGQSVGDNIIKIKFISTKDGQNSKIKFLLRIIYKSLILFALADLGYANLTTISMALTMFPIKFSKGKYTYYSFLSVGFNSTYINKD